MIFIIILGVLVMQGLFIIFFSQAARNEKLQDPSNKE